MSLYKIDDVAKECGLTKRTIRYYEEIGVMPSPQRTDGGTRLYTREDIDYLKKVVRAKEVLGFSLQELHTYIAMADVLNEQRFDYQQTTEVKDRIEKLTSMDETLGGQLQLIEQKLQSIHAVQAELEDLRERVQNGIQRLQKNEITKHPEDG
ncbi:MULTISPECIES: MerR family transcriptional regulator [Paenibacillus]|uniref:HTH-type transcriptional regulator yfmP n=1 Tax=Paenibacillus illinoisensis TaxID=59845 RepID=A0A2W0CH69_9BACL|nr:MULTISPECIES: MerR family transcriptional regulator [Paenibacillus]PAD28132.1 MerR family transcriptional regulator [Paenibacillus sp. 7523-1]PYY31384.1 HTH-type transcriptional regulator yfmP [Paenibacillus illinoisensis]